MAEADSSLVSNISVKDDKMLQSCDQCLKTERIRLDSVSSEITSSDSDPSTTENTLTSLTPDPDLTQTDTNYIAEDDQSQNCSFDSESSCTCMDESSPQKRRRKLPNFQAVDWYMNRCFSNYWKNYYLTMSWCQKHFNVMKSMRPYVSSQFSPYPVVGQTSSRGSLSQISRGRGLIRGRGRRGVSTSAVCGRGRGRGKEINSEMEQQLPKAESLASCNDESDNDSEIYEMEITDEMLQFFAHSEKHRKERDADKMDGSGTEEKKLIDIENVKSNQKVPTCKAPTERPGMRRTAEMIQLYGKGAAMIHGMETALQMTFDRNMDIKQPKYWPNMPLKITFQ